MYEFFLSYARDNHNPLLQKFYDDLMQATSKQYDSRTYFSVIYESAKRQVVLSSVPVIR